MAEKDANVNEDQEKVSDEEAVDAAEPAPEQPDAAEPAAEEPATAEPAAEEPAAEEAPAEEPAGEPSAAKEPAAKEPAPAATEPAVAEPEEVLSAKEMRKRERSVHTGEALPARSPEERSAERSEARRRKAVERRAYRPRARERARTQGPAEPAPADEPAAPGRRKLRLGVVVSDAGDKTITVRVDVARQHRTYGKIVRSSAKLHAHDEANDAHVGDTVRVVETRPLSRTKRWRLVEVLERAR